MKKYSQGAKQDIFIAMFASAMISTSYHEDSIADDTVITRKDNRLHKTNRKIDKQLKEVNERIKSLVKNDLDRVTLKFLMDKRLSKMMKVMNDITDQNKTVSLESLGVWILHANFVEREKPLDDRIAFLQDYDYLKIADMILETEAEAVEGEMYDQADRAIRMLS